jgi:Tfp pilus assembly protein PilV
MMRPKGFTFVELLVALSLFMVGMVSILVIFPLDRRYLAQSAYATQAVSLAQEKIEQVRALSYDDLTIGTYEAKATVSSTSGDQLVQFSRATTVTLLDANRAVVSPQDSAHDVGLKEVDVTVYWSENGISRQYTLTTYVYE